MSAYVPCYASGFVDEIGNEKTLTTSLATALEISDTLATAHDVVDISLLDDFSIVVENTGANPIDEVSIEHSQGPAGPWEVFDNTYFATGVTPLAAGASKSLENNGNGRKYMRIRAKTSTGSSTVKCSLFGKTKKV